ncbi:hypothetical protein HDE_05924 [Halotydeus destructor]|nr:hypothetical protein HDE_05924 [Halotydeus destructor]
MEQYKSNFFIAFKSFVFMYLLIVLILELFVILLSIVSRTVYLQVFVKIAPQQEDTDDHYKLIVTFVFVAVNMLTTVLQLVGVYWESFCLVLSMAAWTFVLSVLANIVGMSAIIAGHPAATFVMYVLWIVMCIVYATQIKPEPAVQDSTNGAILSRELT